MKRFVLLALAAVSAFATLAPAKAQEYAPLIQKETVSVGRINLDKLDADNLSAQAQKVASAAVDYFVEDKEKAKEFKESLSLVKVMISGYFTTTVQPLKDAGVKNVYVVVEQSDDPDETLYPYLAIPTESLTKDQLDGARNAMKNLNQQLGSVLKYRFVRNGFFYTLIVPDDADDDEVKAYVKKRFTKLNTVEKSQFADGFKLAGDSGVVTFVSLSAKNEGLAASQIEKVSEQLDELGDQEGMEEVGDKLKDFIQFASDLNLKCADLVKFNVQVVDLDNLETVSRTVANSDGDAKKYADLMKTDLGDKINELIDFGYSKATEQMKDSPVSKDDLDAAVAAVKDVVALFLNYDVEGSEVVWKMNEKFWTKNETTIKNLVEKGKVIFDAFQADIDVDASSSADDEELDLDEEE